MQVLATVWPSCPLWPSFPITLTVGGLWSPLWLPLESPCPCLPWHQVSVRASTDVSCKHLEKTVGFEKICGGMKTMWWMYFTALHYSFFAFLFLFIFAIFCFELLKREYFLYFWLVNKTRHLRVTPWALGTVINIRIPNILTFYGQNN